MGDVESLPKICKPLVVYRFLCMAQTRHHMINIFPTKWEIKALLARPILVCLLLSPFGSKETVDNISIQ